MVISELVTKLRNIVGDNNLEEPNITDAELKTILENSAAAYSRIKSVIEKIETPYDKNEEYYDLPDECYKVKSILIKELNLNLKFIDNMTQVILEELPDVDSMTLKITYSRYFKPEEIDIRDIDIYLLYAEGLCYKLMASKTADLIKFSTGEKIIDESGISKKYLELFELTEKSFRKKVIKAYGKRADNPRIDLDYALPYPTRGETP